MPMISEMVSVPAGHVTLGGDFAVPTQARAVVLYAYGVDDSGVGGARAQAITAELNAAGYATLSLRLLSEHEKRDAALGGGQDVDIGLLGRRVVAGADWLKIQPGLRALPVVLFGAGTEAAAVLEAAAELPDLVLTAVVWGGRPDLASDALGRMQIPVLLIADDEDPGLLRRTEQAGQRLGVPHTVRVVPDGLGRVASAAREWCDERLRASREAPER